MGREGEGQGIYHYHNTDVSDNEEERAIFIGYVQFGPSHYGLEGYLWRREEAVNRLPHVTYIHTPTMYSISTTYTHIKTSMNTYMHTHIHACRHTHTYSTYIYPNTHTLPSDILVKSCWSLGWQCRKVYTISDCCGVMW